ncbi:MAG TPA: hypothetical protein VM694_06735 [Polyangium sp.]|nr:hypothetical protein [Polyangium sp.]
MVLRSLSFLVVFSLLLSGCDPDDNPAGCPAEEPKFYGGPDCDQKGLTCNYVRDDGCPTVRTCDLQPGGSGWSFYNTPSEGAACETPGQECFYGSPDCGGFEVTATCGPDGKWMKSSMPDGCGG